MVTTPSTLSAGRKAGVTIGNFDGVHLGHQKLVKRTLEVCRQHDLDCVVVTFWPHPRAVFSGQHMPPLADQETRRQLLGQLGVNYLLVCVIAAIPMLMVGTLHLGSNTLISIVGEPVSICIMLVLIATGVRLIVQTCVRQGGFDRLLEEGDYTRINKRLGKYDTIYWCLVTALYLGTSFLTEMWDRTWIIWPVAGVLFAVYREILKMRVR